MRDEGSGSGKVLQISFHIWSRFIYSRCGTGCAPNSNASSDCGGVQMQPNSTEITQIVVGMKVHSMYKVIQ